MSKWYSQKHTVAFWECDPSKTAHNSRYFIWFEEARFAIAKEAKLLDYIGKCSEERITFPVLEAECKFLLPIPCDAKLLIRTKLDKPKMAKLIFKHIVTDEVTKKDYAIAITTVGILSDKSGLQMNIDESIKKIIYDYLES